MKKILLKINNQPFFVLFAIDMMLFVAATLLIVKVGTSSMAAGELSTTAAITGVELVLMVLLWVNNGLIFLNISRLAPNIDIFLAKSPHCDSTRSIK